MSLVCPSCILDPAGDSASSLIARCGSIRNVKKDFENIACSRFALTFSLSVLCILAKSIPARAATVTYNFTYSGTNIFDPSATSTGSGSFTITYSNIGPQPPSALTDFSFTTTLTTSDPQPQSSTFVYTLADIALSPGIILSGSVDAPMPAQIAVVTKSLFGSNSAFGTVAADFNMLPAGGSVLTQGFAHAGSNAGPAVWTSFVSAPEPSLFGLVPLGTMIVALRVRSRSAALKSGSATSS